jgi:single-stranded-DNA-specific exonuclease
MQPVKRKRWQIAEKIPAEIDQTMQAFNPLLRQLLYNRQITTPDDAQIFISKSGSLYDPFLLNGMEAAVERLWYAIDHGELIAVYGDYDVDGVTATALMVQVLRRLGGSVCGYIPARFEEGYGLNVEALQKLAADGVKLVLTVDCGIRAPNEVEAAHELGIDVIISDHHEPRDTIPAARSVICHKQPGDMYPEKNLAGVGLAYKIAEALLSRRERPDVQVEEWLDLVAIGTVADIVPLMGENRALVKAGLERLKTGMRQGVVSLCGAAGIDVRTVCARDIGYGLGPRLNAAGRLESALDALDLLMETDLHRAGVLAQQLDNQNQQRQHLTEKMQEQAELMIGVQTDDHLLFAAHPEFNMGVVGLVASRLTDRYYRPSVAASIGEEYTRASCRSIPEFHITKALDECAGLLVRHGGHAMAAGFTVRNENLPELMHQMKSIAMRELAGADLRPVLRADMEIALQDLRTNVLDTIDGLEPTGLANPGVLFVARNIKVQRFRTVGKDNTHLKMTVNDNGLVFDAIAFRQGHWAEQMPARVDLLFAFEKNVFKGNVSLQLNVRDMKTAGEPD